MNVCNENSCHTVVLILLAFMFINRRDDLTEVFISSTLCTSSNSFSHKAEASRRIESAAKSIAHRLTFMSAFSMVSAGRWRKVILPSASSAARVGLGTPASSNFTEAGDEEALEHAPSP